MIRRTITLMSMLALVGLPGLALAIFVVARGRPLPSALPAALAVIAAAAVFALLERRGAGGLHHIHHNEEIDRAAP